MADLAALIERLEKLTGPDREVDELVWCVEEPRIEPLLPYWTSEQCESLVPRYTASLDAVIALVERELPGRLWEVMGNGKPDDQPWASIHQDFTHWSGVGATPAIALCIALLKAKGGDNG